MSPKKLLIAVLIAGFAAMAARAQQPLVWCGLDYSKVEMIGTQDFRQPTQIFPGMLDAWNGLFMNEMLPKLEKMDPSLESDLDGITARNKKADEKQILRQDGTPAEMVNKSDITADDLQRIVRKYDLKHKEGMGLTFVMDRLVKAQETGCLYVVFFDIGSRKVLYSERRVEKAGGFGFRNYWFNPVKKTVDQLPRMYDRITPPKPRKGPLRP